MPVGASDNPRFTFENRDMTLSHLHTDTFDKGIDDFIFTLYDCFLIQYKGDARNAIIRGILGVRTYFC